MNTKTIHHTGSWRRRAAWFFFGVNAFFLVAYLFLLNGIVLKAASYERLTEKADTLSVRVSELETRYIERGRTLTLDYAYSLGFKDATGSALFASRSPVPANGAALSVRSGERLVYRE